VLFTIVALALSTWVEGYQWQMRSLAGVILILIGNVVVLSKRGFIAQWIRRTG